jgi:anti-sigma-K factor RskA
MSGAQDEIDAPEMLAGEYVLGTLDAGEADAARTRLGTDPAFASEVRAWERQLFPLTALVPAVEPPPAVWTRIEDTTGGATVTPFPVGSAPRAANDNPARVWRATAIVALAACACLAAFVVTRPAAPPAFAVLAPTGGAAPVLVALAGANGALLLRPSGVITVAADRDLQLWSLPAGAKKPQSLGVLPAAGTQVPPGIAQGTQLLVSLEPKGGSPTGQPTGPVVYGGVLRGL